jgi:hypothetical protein
MKSLIYINPTSIVSIKIRKLTLVDRNYYEEPYYIEENTRTKWFGLKKLTHPPQIGYYGWDRIDSIKYFTQNLTQYQLIDKQVYHSPSITIYLANKDNRTLYFKTDNGLLEWLTTNIPNYTKWITF